VSKTPDGQVEVCVLVRGVIVAWFREFDDAALAWCQENYFGEWLTWPATTPTLIYLTEQEDAEVRRRAAELHAKLHRSYEKEAGK
jgi:hypothetical protein